MKNVLIVTENFEKIKNKILKEGKENFHVLADFDRTLTKAVVNGVKTSSIISELRTSNYLGEDYMQKANELANKYQPIEIDSKLSIEEKKPFMKEWWQKHFDLLLKSGLTKSHVKEVVEKGFTQFREGVKDFLKFLYENKIPLVILSSGGLGGDSIKMFLEKEKVMFSNIYIVANYFIWDKNGKASGYEKPIIHVMNKDETILENFEFYEKIKLRKNVLLLGDSLGDLGMIEGFDYSTLIKIGFLNFDVEKNLETYKKNFDVLILNHSSFEFVDDFVKEFKG